MHTAGQYVRERRQVQMYPLGCDDPTLPDELRHTADIMRAVRDAQFPPPSRDTLIEVVQLLRGHGP